MLCMVLFEIMLNPALSEQVSATIDLATVLLCIARKEPGVIQEVNFATPMAIFSPGRNSFRSPINNEG